MLLAFGENKAGIVQRAVEGPVTEQVPASFLQAHPNATAYLDISSSAGSCKHMSGPVLSPSFLIRVPGFIGRHHAGSAQVRPPHPGSWATSNRCYMRAGLTRVCSPWLLGPVAWDGYLVKRAVIWLSLLAGKAILRLTDSDYTDNHLQVRATCHIYPSVARDCCF